MRMVAGAVGAALWFALLAVSAGPAGAAAPLVLFDEGHGQPFTIGQDGDLQLSSLSAVIRERGAEVRPVRGRLDAAALAQAQALVISGAFAPLEAAEREAVRRFLEGGGRLAVMLHIADPLQGLLGDLSVAYSRGPVHEREQLIESKETSFTVTRFTPHALTEGLTSMSVFGCWALVAQRPGSSVIAKTGPHAWLDTNRDQARSPGEPAASHGVLVAGTVGRGEFAVFGDDAVFQNRFLAAYNMELGRRLARWLVGGGAPKRPGVTDL